MEFLEIELPVTFCGFFTTEKSRISFGTSIFCGWQDGSEDFRPREDHFTRESRIVVQFLMVKIVLKYQDSRE